MHHLASDFGIARANSRLHYIKGLQIIPFLSAYSQVRKVSKRIRVGNNFLIEFVQKRRLHARAMAAAYSNKRRSEMET